MAIGVALSVVPVIFVILMLFTKRAKTNSVAFLGGWLLGLAVAGGIGLAIVAADLTSGQQVGVLAVFILLASLTVAAPVITHSDAVMAVLFLVFGVRLLGDRITILAG